MRVGICCPKCVAKQVKQALEAANALDKRVRVINSEELVTFPVVLGFDGDFGEVLPELHDSQMQWKVVRECVFGSDGEGRKSGGIQSLREWLAQRLSPSELEHVNTAFSLIGDTVVIEIPPAVQHLSGTIAEGLMATNKGVHRVCRPTGEHEGAFRVQPLEVIKGSAERPITANYREHGCQFHIHIDRVFFSPRLAAERSRISACIEPGERVCVMFAGTGPFPIVFAKNSTAQEIVAIELNPAAVENMRENVRQNGVSERVEVIEGDVREIAKVYLGVFDRIVMPIPHDGGELFLSECLPTLKPGGICHFYDVVMCEPSCAFAEATHRITAQTRGQGVGVRLQRVVRRFSPRQVQVVTDFVVR